MYVRKLERKKYISGKAVVGNGLVDNILEVPKFIMDNEQSIKHIAKIVAGPKTVALKAILDKFKSGSGFHKMN